MVSPGYLRVLGGILHVSGFSRHVGVVVFIGPKPGPAVYSSDLFQSRCILTGYLSVTGYPSVNGRWMSPQLGRQLYN